MFDQLSKGYKELDEDQEMVSPAQVCAMFVDWIDPQKAMYETETTPCAQPIIKSYRTVRVSLSFSYLGWLTIIFKLRL